MLSVCLLPTFLSLWLLSTPRTVEIHDNDNEILFSPNVSKNNDIFFSVCHYFRHQKKQATREPMIIQLLLLLSGSVELNPGPARVKFPCGECKRAVTKRGKSIACDNCLQWFHKNGVGMNETIFNCYSNDQNLEWICTKCGIHNVSTSLFNSSISSNSSNESVTVINDPNKKKANKLRILTCNFQSIWNKKEELECILTSSNIDLLIGSETHLSCNIKNSEFIPSNYQAFRKDRNDGYGGVIIIAKNSLIIEQINCPGNAEIVAVKVETFQKPIIISSCYRSTSNAEEDNEILANTIQDVS